MNPLAHAVDDYIKLRRGLGFKPIFDSLKN